MAKSLETPMIFVGFSKGFGPVSKERSISLPVILIASDLASGGVVYWAGDRGWSSDKSQALQATTLDDAGALEQAADEAVRRNQVVEAYLVEIEAGTWPPEARHFREKRKMIGPSTGPQAFQTQPSGAAHVSL